jgi:TPR repeat protein
MRTSKRPVRLRPTISKTLRYWAVACTAAVGGYAAGGLPIALKPAGPTFAGFTTPALARDVTYANPTVAYEQGLGAYRSGYYEIAIPALEHVSTKGTDPLPRLMAEFYLARIFADSTGAQTDHAKAYILFQRIADEYADIDPDDAKRAPIVAKALTAVAIYVRDGVAEIGLQPDLQRAVEYLRHAATFFNEADAQFELAKINIGDEAQRRNGLHFLQKLAKEYHPGAQAVLADLMMRGKYVPQDRAQALALIKMAVENATSSERIWIEDIYQNIYCGSTADVREKSKTFVADWRKRFSQPRSVVEQPLGLGRRPELGMPARVCANGERLETRGSIPADVPTASTATIQPPSTSLGLMPSGTSRP